MGIDERVPGTLWRSPVLTINASSTELINKLRSLSRGLDVYIIISEVTGFGRPELRLQEGYLSGEKKYRKFY